MTFDQTYPTFSSYDSYYAGRVEYYDGPAISSKVPQIFDIALGGHNYNIDYNQPFYRQMREQMQTVVRTQADQGPQPGEQTMDPNGLWRRSVEDWRIGAGQRYVDRKQSAGLSSQPNAFWQSRGIDAITTAWQFTLLPDTESVFTTTNTNVICIPVNDYLYVIDGDTILFSQYPFTSNTAVIPFAGVNISSICTDGFNVYVCVGEKGVYQTTMAATTATQLITSALDPGAKIAYTNGRLMLVDEQSIWNITETTSSALGTNATDPNPLIYTAGAPNFVFQAISGGNTEIYVAGNTINGDGDAVDGGIIYGITIASDGTTLNPPTVEGVMPNGEVIGGIYCYLNNMVVYTSAGIRFCAINEDGSLSLGSVITLTNQPAFSFTENYLMYGVGAFVYFPWYNIDGDNTGLGKVSLENFVVENVLPAYQSDLMANTQGKVSSVAAVYTATPSPWIVFTVNTPSGGAVYVQSENLVENGFIDSGYILYDLVDPKIATALDIRSEGPLKYGSYSVLVSADAGEFNLIGTHKVGDPEPVTFAENVGAERFEIRVQLARDETDLTMGPVINRWTLRSYPAPIRPLTWSLPITLNESLANRSGTSTGYDVLAELQFLYQALNSGEQILFQRGQYAFLVYVSDVAFLADHPTEHGLFFDGLALVSLLGVPNNI